MVIKDIVIYMYVCMYLYSLTWNILVFVFLLSQAEKTARLKAETQERTLRRFLLSQKHVVYTEPLFIHAGKMVRVFYNPSNTVLNGKEEVWFKCSFNRWTHPNGPLPPQKMVRVSTGTYLQAIGKIHHYSILHLYDIRTVLIIISFAMEY